MKRIYLLTPLIALTLLISGCGGPAAWFATATPTPSMTPSPTATWTPSPTNTPTITPTPTPSQTPTITPTPTVTPTPTFDFPDVTLLKNAHCRFGPGIVYLHAIDLWEGDKGVVHNRNYDGSWLYIQPEKWDNHCWVSASVVEVDGDIFSVIAWESPLPWTKWAGPPKNVAATRNGNQVTISWSSIKVPPEDKRGYLIKATVCANGVLIDAAYHTDKTKFTLTDDQNCEGKSKGVLYGVEKHGYTKPVNIPWP